ncbi:MAG: YihY/virulence factor BrkB family protein [Armatimonadota bacterium]
MPQIKQVFKKPKEFNIHIHSFIKSVFQDYSKGNGALISAAVTYYVFLSFIPVLILSISITAFIIGSKETAQSTIISSISEFSPVLMRYTDDIETLVDELIRGSKLAFIISCLVLFWTVSSALANIEKAINHVWNVFERRGFVARRLLTLIGMIVLALLLLLSIALTASLELLKARVFNISWIPNYDIPVLWKILGIFIPLLVSIIAFTLLYKYVPNTKVPIIAAIWGGVFSGIAWEIVKQVFSFYASNYAQYNRIYGSLGGAVLLLVWIYWTSVITIIGAALSSKLARLRVG